MKETGGAMFGLQVIWDDGQESRFNIAENQVNDVYDKLNNGSSPLKIVWPEERQVLVTETPHVRI